jgi:hypothetical protein
METRLGESRFAKRCRVVDLADPYDLAASDRTVLGDSRIAESLDIHLIEQHRVAVVRELDEERDAPGHSSGPNHGIANDAVVGSSLIGVSPWRSGRGGGRRR